MTTYSPLETLFTPIGCSGLTYAEFGADMADRLNKAPFLSYKITSSNYPDFMEQVLSILMGIRSSGAAGLAAYTGADSKPLYGPVYMLAGMNAETNAIEAFMYFPSLQKDGRPWQTYTMLCFYHRWMYTMLYSKGMNVKPIGNCVKRVKNAPVTFGCYSTTGKCNQDERTLKQMGIFDRKKSRDYDKSNPVTYGYPVAYMRSYIINSKDQRVREFYNKNSFPSLQLNAIVPDFEVIAGCEFILVSQGYTFFMMLENSSISIFRNKIGADIVSACSRGVDLKKVGERFKTIRFPGRFDTRMVIEDNVLNVYSKPTRGSSETLAYSIALVKDPSNVQQPIVLLLNDEGALVVYDKNNVEITNNEVNDMTPAPGAPASHGADYSGRMDREQRYRALADWVKVNAL